MIKIYTDGACSNNPGPGGWAIIIENNQHIYVQSGSKENTTNNAMELTAVFRALKWFDDNAIYENLTIYTDSAYISNCFSQKWYIKWRQNNWITSSHSPVLNKDLWEKILWLYECLITSGINIKIEKVKRHSNNIYNNLADKYAVLAKKGKNYNGVINK